MSKVMSVFFETREQLPEVARKLENLGMGQFSTIESEYGSIMRYARDSLIVKVFDNHGLVNDMGIPFEKYPYEMDFESLDRTVNHESFVRESAISWAFRLFQEYQWSNLVVDNLQHIIKRFDKDSNLES